MKKFNIYLCIISFILIQNYCDAKKSNNNSAQEGLQEMSDVAHSMDTEITKTGTSIGNLVKNIKGIFDSTAKEMDDDNSDSIQSCQQNLKELNNKFNIIYEYANSKLKDILQNKKYKTVDAMYNEIAQLQSIWNSITNLPTADQVSQFLKTHNEFYNSMNKYVNNQDNNNSVSNNKLQNMYNNMYSNNNNAYNRNSYGNNLYNNNTSSTYNNNSYNYLKPVMKVISSNNNKKQWNRKTLFGNLFK